MDIKRDVHKNDLFVYKHVSSSALYMNETKLSVIWILLLHDIIRNCIPFKADQASFCRAVTCCSWLEGTVLHTSQQSTKIILISLPSIL